jgi:hypothetical protein
VGRRGEPPQSTRLNILTSSIRAVASVGRGLGNPPNGRLRPLLPRLGNCLLGGTLYPPRGQEPRAGQSRQANREDDRPQRRSRPRLPPFRLPPEEYVELDEAAARSGESISEYIRKALALRLHGDTLASAVGAIYGDAGIPYGELDQLVMRGNLIMSNCRLATNRKLFEPRDPEPFRWWFGKPSAQQHPLFPTKTG